jgi:hypothetical protein
MHDSKRWSTGSLALDPGAPHLPQWQEIARSDASHLTRFAGKLQQSHSVASIFQPVVGLQNIEKQKRSTRFKNKPGTPGSQLLYRLIGPAVIEID